MNQHYWFSRLGVMGISSFDIKIFSNNLILKFINATNILKLLFKQIKLNFSILKFPKKINFFHFYISTF